MPEPGKSDIRNIMLSLGAQICAVELDKKDNKAPHLIAANTVVETKQQTLNHQKFVNRNF